MNQSQNQTNLNNNFDKELKILKRFWKLNLHKERGKCNNSNREHKSMAPK